MAAGEIVMTQMGYAVARSEPAKGVIVSHPVDVRSGRLRAGDGVLSSSAASRRVVEVRVESTAEGTRVYCQVANQELASQEYQLFRAAHSGDEGIGETAIDRDAATTTEQNTVWRTVSRDRAEERAILDAIERRTGPPPSNRG